MRVDFFGILSGSINVEHEGVGPVDGYYHRVIEFHVAQDKYWNL